MRILAVVASLVTLAAAPSAQNVAATQNVRIYATNVTRFAFNDAATQIVLNDVNPDGKLVGTGQTSLRLVTNLLSYKITGRLGHDFAPGVALSAQLDMSSVILPQAISPVTPRQTMSASVDKNLATGLVALSAPNMVLRYDATAPLDVGSVYDETQEVVLTLTSVGL